MSIDAEDPSDYRGDWILLPSGTEFYVLDPKAEEVHITDIAHNLANNCRFHGSSRKHYSVAEHSLYVAYLLRNEPIVTQVQAILHDATEAYLPDLAPQVKLVIPQFKALEDRLWQEICLRFGIPAEKPFIIKAADMACLVPEFKQLLPPSRIPMLERNTELLQERYPKIIEEACKLKIRVLSQSKAEREFLRTFRRLLRQMEDSVSCEPQPKCLWLRNANRRFLRYLKEAVPLFLNLWSNELPGAWKN